MEKGLIHIYTGGGKGKTTAALGLCYRASMQGLKVGFTSFMKDFTSGELKKETCFKIFRHKPFCGFWRELSEEEKALAKSEAEESLKNIFKTAKEECYDVIALDEVLVAAEMGCVDTKLLIKLLLEKPASLEVVLTGCIFPKEVKELADYISEIKAVKHPYEKGINARKGIEY